MLTQSLSRASAVHGNTAAYRNASGWAITYADLDRLSDEAAGWLLARGLSEGSVLALCLPSGVEYIVAYLAAAKAGVVTAGINPRFVSRERNSALDTLQPDLVLASPEVANSLAPHLEIEQVSASESLEQVLTGQRRVGHVPRLLPEDPDRPVCICFTSGSTGQPKGAWFTNRQLRTIAELDTGGVWGGGGHRYASTEFAHVGVMTKLPWLLAGGGTTHLLDRWRAETVLGLIDRYRMASVAAIVPQIALMLRVEALERFDLGCVKAIVGGGAHAPPQLIRQGREVFGAPWSVRYSSTESGGVGLATALAADDTEALHTVGRPRTGVEAEIRDDDGNLVAAGEVGELWLRSGAVMSGYWNNPAETAATLVEGWLRTGDLARVDERGCHVLAGRVTEMFIRGGYNVYPLEVEGVLAGHPKVAQVAVVPRPDDVMGEIGVAVVVPADPADAPSLEDLRTHASVELAAYKLPEALRVVKALPVNATDKVDRRALVETERT